MVYRRYTNFAIESQAMYFDGDPDFGKRLTCTVPRRGDLLGAMTLEVVLPYLKLANTNTSVAYVNSTGHALIEEISLEIGEQEIDKQTGEWMEIWSELTVSDSKIDGFKNMINKADGGIPPPVTDQSFDFTTNTSGSGYQYGSVKLYIPLQFWFNKNPGLYLPLLAMQYHPIRINLKLRPLQEMFYVDGLAEEACGSTQVELAKIIDIRLWGDYVYLDTEERRRFVSNTHEYLIEQIQYTPKISIPKDIFSTQVRLEFNHPVRELIWRIQRDKAESAHEFFNFGSSIKDEIGRPRDMLQDAIIQVDGYDRFERRDAGYFRLVQPYQYHTNVPTKTYVYCYSFSLRPEEMQPSGSLNASRIDDFTLQVSLRPDYPFGPMNPNTNQPNPMYAPPRGNANIRVYAKNHNVLRVVNGFAGLLFKI